MAARRAHLLVAAAALVAALAAPRAARAQSPDAGGAPATNEAPAIELQAAPPAPDAGTPAPPSSPESPTPGATPTDAQQPPPQPGAAATPPAGTTPGAPTTPATDASRMVALIDVAPLGVDPAAGTFLTETLRNALAQQGYTTVPIPQLYEVARRLQLPFPPTPEHVAALLRELNVPIAVTAELRATSGYYQATLRARFAAEPAERYRQVLATQWTLGDSVRAALTTLLAPPGTPGAGPGESIAPLLPDMTNIAPPPRRRPTRIHPDPFEVGVGLEFAWGPGQETQAFWNMLGYARVAWFPFDRFGITASVSYANLRARTGRTNNVLFMVGAETAVDIMPRQRVYLPLRAEVGYLPFNGPVLRATAGVGIGITRSIRLELDLLTPTVWFLPGAVAVSLDFGAQIMFGFGAPPRRRRARRNTESPAAAESGSAPGRSSSTSGSAPASGAAPAGAPAAVNDVD